MALDPFDGLTIEHTNKTWDSAFVRCNQFGIYPHAYLTFVHAEHIERMRLILECAKAFKAIVDSVEAARFYNDSEWDIWEYTQGKLANIKSTLSDPELVKLVESWTQVEGSKDAD